MFIPLESKFPNRTIIPIYEYPDSNPRLFLENKRGFRLFFVAVFISNKMAAEYKLLNILFLVFTKNCQQMEL